MSFKHLQCPTIFAEKPNGVVTSHEWSRKLEIPGIMSICCKLIWIQSHTHFPRTCVCTPPNFILQTQPWLYGASPASLLVFFWILRGSQWTLSTSIEINYVFPQALDGYRQQTDNPSCRRDRAKEQTVPASCSCELTAAVQSHESSQASNPNPY